MASTNWFLSKRFPTSLTAAFGKGGPKGGGNDSGSTGNDKVKLNWLNPVTNAPTYSASCTPDAECLILGERGLIVAVPPGSGRQADGLASLCNELPMSRLRCGVIVAHNAPTEATDGIHEDCCPARADARGES